MTIEMAMDKRALPRSALKFRGDWLRSRAGSSQQLANFRDRRCEPCSASVPPTVAQVKLYSDILRAAIFAGLQCTVAGGSRYCSV